MSSSENQEFKRPALVQPDKLTSKLQGAITSEDVLGKDVIDSSGVFIGVSDKFYIDPKTMIILGISVDKGFLQKGFIISTQYISEVAKHAVFLNMHPVALHKGKTVFGLNGANIGKIVSVELVQDTNSIKSIIVRRGIFGKRIKISEKYIASTKANIFLNITKLQLDEKMISTPTDWRE